MVPNQELIMRQLLFSLLVTSTLGLSAQAQEDIVAGQFELNEKDLAAIESDPDAEIIPVRRQYENESDADYRKYVYGVAGLDTHMLPVNVFVGIGVRDSRGIIAGEARVKGNLLGVYGGGRNSAVGIGAQGYFHPFRMVTKEGNRLGNFYVSAGHTRYMEAEGDPEKSYLSRESSTEVGYEFNKSVRLGIGRDRYTFERDDDVNAYVLKLNVKFRNGRR